MDNQASTPRPWKEFYADEENHGITGNDGKVACFWTDFSKNSEANASLIVKAVNNHDLLLEACREAELWLSGDDQKHPSQAKAKRILLKAIANAEGR